MLNLLAQTYKMIWKLISHTWFKMLILWAMLTVAALAVNLLIPRLSSFIIGNGFSDIGAPSYLWSQNLNSLMTAGTSALKNIGITSFFFQGLYGSFEFIVHNTLLSMIAGFYAFYMLGALKDNHFGLRSMSGAVKPAARYMMGLWFIIILLAMAGGIGALEQIFFNTQPTGDSMSMLAAWTIVGSVVVIGLCVLFIRFSLLPYVRCVASERFVDSVRFSFHLTSGNFWLIVIVMIPVVLISYALFYYTRSILFLGTVCQQFGVLLVVVFESSLFTTLTTWKEQSKALKETERLG